MAMVVSEIAQPRVFGKIASREGLGNLPRAWYFISWNPVDLAHGGAIATISSVGQRLLNGK